MTRLPSALLGPRCGAVIGHAAGFCAPICANRASPLCARMELERSLGAFPDRATALRVVLASPSLLSRRTDLAPLGRNVLRFEPNRFSVRGRVASALAVWRRMTWGKMAASCRVVHVVVATDVCWSVPESMIRSRSRDQAYSGGATELSSPRRGAPADASTTRRCRRSTTAARPPADSTLLQQYRTAPVSTWHRQRPLPHSSSRSIGWLSARY